MEIKLVQIQAALSAANSCLLRLDPKKAIPHIDHCILLARCLEKQLLKNYTLKQWLTDKECNCSAIESTQSKIKNMREVFM